MLKTRQPNKNQSDPKKGESLFPGKFAQKPQRSLIAQPTSNSTEEYVDHKTLQVHQLLG